jgi:uncharacterized DUF497 family protein
MGREANLTRAWIAKTAPRWYNCYSGMRFQFDEKKSKLVEKKHGVSLEDAKEIFSQAYLVDRKNDDPAQYRAIGWCGGRLCSVIFEIRFDTEGEFYHLITAWKSTKPEERSYAENI